MWPPLLPWLLLPELPFPLLLPDDEDDSDATWPEEPDESDAMEPPELEDKPEMDLVNPLDNPLNAAPKEWPIELQVNSEKSLKLQEFAENLLTNFEPCPLDSGLIKCADLMIFLPASDTASPPDAINWKDEFAHVSWKRNRKFNFTLDSLFLFATPNIRYLW